MTGLVDLFVLRRIAVLGEGKPARATLPALIEDCDCVNQVESRVCDMERGLLIRRRKTKRAEYLVVTSVGHYALANEHHRHRDSTSFTNR